MNHPSQFVRPLPGARAIGRRAAPSSCSSATHHYRQHRSTHERGRGVPYEAGAKDLVYRASIHAEGHDWSAFRGRAGFSVAFDGSPHLAVRHSTTRAGRPFVVGRFPEFSGLRGGCSRHLANVETLGRRTVQSLCQGLPSHFIASNRYGPEPSDGGQRSVPKQAGEFPKKQGERQHVSCV